METARFVGYPRWISDDVMESDNDKLFNYRSIYNN